MATETIAQIRSWFSALKKPTQAQFWAVFDSFAHKTRDYDLMGGGLKPHSALRPYKTGEATIVSGRIWISDTDQFGEFSESTWTPFTDDPSKLGLPKYEYDKTDYELGNQVIYKGEVWEAIWDVGDFGGIAPDDPEGDSYWIAIVFNDGGFIPVYAGGGFVKYNRVYSYRGSEAAKGFYRCMRSDVGFDGGFKSTDFETELENGDWRLEAAESTGSGGPIDSVPTEGSVNAVSSNGTFDALATKADLVSGKVPAGQLPGYVDDVLEFVSQTSFPGTGEAGKVYVALDTNKTYRWTGSVYVIIGNDLALGDTSATAYRGDRGKIAYDHSQNQSTDMEADKASPTKWGDIKLIYDWAVGLFFKLSNLATDFSTINDATVPTTKAVMDRVTTTFIDTMPTEMDDVTKGYIVGSRVIAQDNHSEWLCTDHTESLAVWEPVGTVSFKQEFGKIEIENGFFQPFTQLGSLPGGYAWELVTVSAKYSFGTGPYGSSREHFSVGNQTGIRKQFSDYPDSILNGSGDFFGQLIHVNTQRELVYNNLNESEEIGIDFGGPALAVTATGTLVIYGLARIIRV